MKKKNQIAQNSYDRKHNLRIHCIHPTHIGSLGSNIITDNSYTIEVHILEPNLFVTIQVKIIALQSKVTN